MDDITMTQARVIKVLNNMIELVEKDVYYADVFSEELEGMLSDLQGDDVFGTEAQNDPRGDFRNGEWSMDCVENIDDCVENIDEDDFEEEDS